MHTNDHAWVLVDEQPARSLGGVMAWAHQRGVRGVDLLVERDAGTLVRRAACFVDPVAVWQVDGSTVIRAEPQPLEAPLVPSETALDLVGALRDAGLEIVIEHGEVRGEVLGLEVARVVVDHAGTRIEVGVGRNDREAFAMVHGETFEGTDALVNVVAEVRRHRRPGDLTHPLARLAAERWLRSEVVRTPSLVGARDLEPVEPTVRRDNLKDPSPAIAVGRDAGGVPMVVACSVGVDLDLVPSAADARSAYVPDARLVLVMPERDALPVTRRLAELLLEPAEVVTVSNDFRG